MDEDRQEGLAIVYELCQTLSQDLKDLTPELRENNSCIPNQDGVRTRHVDGPPPKCREIVNRHRCGSSERHTYGIGYIWDMLVVEFYLFRLA